MRSSPATTAREALNRAQQQLQFALEDAVDMLALVRNLAVKDENPIGRGAKMNEGLDAFLEVIEGIREAQASVAFAQGEFTGEGPNV